MFDNTYIEDEIRLGFYIPSQIKQAWAAELEILSVIDSICKKNSLRYFADWGTFLGAVRHNGFIPWDDDLDLVMFREDYNKFLEIAPNELPSGYEIHTFRNEEGFIEFHAVVQNTNHPRFDKDHYNRFHGFNYIAGVDIFVLDYVHLNEEDELKRIKDVTYIIALADGILDNKYNEKAKKLGISKVEKMFNISINTSQPTKNLWIDLYELAEKKCSEVSKADALYATQMVPWGLKNQLNRRYLISEYEKTIYLPFENSYIPIPLFYDKLLNQRYNNYMRLVKNGGAHDYPYFSSQQKELETLLGHRINHFSYTHASNRIIESAPWKDVLKDALQNINIIFNKLNLLSDSFINDICTIQDSCIEIGEFIEAVKGKNHISINSIEHCCEKLYEIYTLVENDNATSVNDSLSLLIREFNIQFSTMIECISNHVLNKKEIVFLPFKAEYWNNMNTLYSEYINDDDFDVYVVPLPYYYKEFDGTLINEQYYPEQYPKSINIVPYNEFSLEFHHPDIIVFQNPYDQYNNATSVHPDYYSNKLRQYSSSLIYIPWFEIADFNQDDIRSFKNMDYYVLMPGVANADIIYLSSEKMIELYKIKLTQWSCVEAHDYWLSKLRLQNKIYCDSLSKSDKKVILYYLSPGLPLQNPENFILHLSNVLKTFDRYKNLIELKFVPDPDLQNTLLKYAHDLYDKYNSLTANIKQYIYSPTMLKECDAYYGDCSFIALEFQYLNKPVMIQDYSR